MKKFSPAPSPNYTQSPNVFFDEWLLEIDSLSELKIVNIIIRYTFGWHCNAVLLSLADYQRFTGLTEPSVIDGIKRAIKRGIVHRVQIGKQTYAYMLNVEGQTPKEFLEASKVSLEVHLLKVFSPASKEFLEVPLKDFKRFENSPYIDKESLKKKEKEKEQQQSAQVELITFELTAERRVWIELHTPEIVHLAEHEIKRLIDWCNDPDYPERARSIRKAGKITETRFHNWMLNAKKFFLEHSKKPQPTKKQPTTNQERNRALLEEFKRKEGIIN